MSPTYRRTGHHQIPPTGAAARGLSLDKNCHVHHSRATLYPTQAGGGVAWCADGVGTLATQQKLVTPCDMRKVQLPHSVVVVVKVDDPIPLFSLLPVRTPMN